MNIKKIAAGNYILAHDGREFAAVQKDGKVWILRYFDNDETMEFNTLKAAQAHAEQGTQSNTEKVLVGDTRKDESGVPSFRCIDCIDYGSYGESVYLSPAQLADRDSAPACGYCGTDYVSVHLSAPSSLSAGNDYERITARAAALGFSVSGIRSAGIGKAFSRDGSVLHVHFDNYGRCFLAERYFADGTYGRVSARGSEKLTTVVRWLDLIQSGETNGELADTADTADSAPVSHTEGDTADSELSREQALAIRLSNARIDAAANERTRIAERFAGSREQAEPVAEPVAEPEPVRFAATAPTPFPTPAQPVPAQPERSSLRLTADGRITATAPLPADKREFRFVAIREDGDNLHLAYSATITGRDSAVSALIAQADKVGLNAIPAQPVFVNGSAVRGWKKVGLFNTRTTALAYVVPASTEPIAIRDALSREPGNALRDFKIVQVIGK